MPEFKTCEEAKKYHEDQLKEEQEGHAALQKAHKDMQDASTMDTSGCCVYTAAGKVYAVWITKSVCDMYKGSSWTSGGKQSDCHT